LESRRKPMAKQETMVSYTPLAGVQATSERELRVYRAVIERRQKQEKQAAEAPEQAPALFETGR
jgi:hypothetical protein